MLLVTERKSRWAAEAEQGRKGRRPAGAPARVSGPRPRPGSERSTTVSLDDRLEDEDTPSPWLHGSSRCHSRSPPVASEYTAGEGQARGRRPLRGSEGTCPSLLTLRTKGRWPRSRGGALLSVQLLGAPSHAPPGPPPFHACCLLLGAGSVSPWPPALGFRGTGAPRATLWGLLALAPVPVEPQGPPMGGLGGVAHRGGGPGPRAGSSAMVSREEPTICTE